MIPGQGNRSCMLQRRAHILKQRSQLRKLRLRDVVICESSFSQQVSEAGISNKLGLTLGLPRVLVVKNPPIRQYRRNKRLRFGPWGTSFLTQTVKNPPAMQETRVQSLGWERPLEKEMATPSSILAWKIPWTEEPGGLQFTG